MGLSQIHKHLNGKEIIIQHLQMMGMLGILDNKKGSYELCKFNKILQYVMRTKH